MKWAELELPILQSPCFNNLRVPDWVTENVLVYNAVPFNLCGWSNFNSLTNSYFEWPFKFLGVTLDFDFVFGLILQILLASAAL